jgi:hypothetical protein
MGEWAYKGIEPRVFAEEWIGPPNIEGIVNYKIFCFDGEPKAFKIVSGHGRTRYGTHYDLELNDLGIIAGEEPRLEPAIRPANFDKMLDLARKLSRGLDFLRVDMYNIDGRIYVGELTSYPNAGIVPFIPQSLDELLGTYWNVSSMTYLPFASLPRLRGLWSSKKNGVPLH